MTCWNNFVHTNYNIAMASAGSWEERVAGWGGNKKTTEGRRCRTLSQHDALIPGRWRRATLTVESTQFSYRPTFWALRLFQMNWICSWGRIQLIASSAYRCPKHHLTFEYKVMALRTLFQLPMPKMQGEPPSLIIKTQLPGICYLHHNFHCNPLADKWEEIAAIHGASYLLYYLPSNRCHPLSHIPDPRTTPLSSKLGT